MCKSGILPLATFFGRFSASDQCWLGPPFSAPSWGLLGCGLPPRLGCVDFEVLPARPQPPLLLRSAPAWSQSVRTAAILALQHPSFCQARRPAYTPPTSPRSAPAWSPLPPEQPQVTCAAPHPLPCSFCFVPPPGASHCTAGSHIVSARLWSSRGLGLDPTWAVYDCHRPCCVVDGSGTVAFPAPSTLDPCCFRWLRLLVPSLGALRLQATADQTPSPVRTRLLPLVESCLLDPSSTRLGPVRAGSHSHSYLRAPTARFPRRLYTPVLQFPCGLCQLAQLLGFLSATAKLTLRPHSHAARVKLLGLPDLTPELRIVTRF